MGRIEGVGWGDWGLVDGGQGVLGEGVELAGVGDMGGYMYVMHFRNSFLHNQIIFKCLQTK